MIAKTFLVVAALHGALAVESLRFLAMGDWGGSSHSPYTTTIELAVARQMASATEMYGSTFNLALGDNFYNTGVRNVDDRRFQTTFEDVYHYTSLMNPWYFLAGNHDHYGNVSAQIAYSQKSNRWNFPDYYYILHFAVPGGKNLDILMIDTVLLCGNSGDDKLGAQPTGPDDDRVAEDQWSWIERQLQSSAADFLLVAGHFPVYSIAEHGPTRCLENRLKPMLYKYGVTAYFCGHDHNLQHISSTEGGKTVDFFVTGAAAKVDPSTAHRNSIPHNTLKFHWAESEHLGGFAYLDATASNLTLTFIDGQNTQLYHYTMSPRQRQKL